MHALCCTHNGCRISNMGGLLQLCDHILMDTGSWDPDEVRLVSSV